MSNLLKSKFFLGGLIAVALLVGVNVNAATMTTTTTTVTASAFTYSGVMKAGMKGPGISTMQAALNSVQTAPQIVVDGSFGPATCAALKMFQMSHSLTADCVMGPMTGAALTAATVAVITIPTPGLPAGCTSTAGYSSTTGTPCNSTSTLPAGCSSTAGYSPTTGAKCDGAGVSTPTGPLAGTAGEISDVNRLSQYNSEEVGSGQNDVKVLGVDVKATKEGDIALKSMKVDFKLSNGSGSVKIADYVDSVAVWMGTTKVGSADASDFNKDSTGNYSKTISLDSSAIVRADKTVKFYVSVTPPSNLDSGDIDSETVYIGIDNMRFEDGSGVVTTDTDTGNLGEMAASDMVDQVKFVDFSTASNTELKISTNNTPDVQVVKVDDVNDTNDVVILKGKMKLDGTSNVWLDELPITLVTVGGANIDSLVNSITLTLGSDTFTESLGTNCTPTCASNTTAVVTFDNLDTTLDAGSTTNFSIAVDLNDIQAGTFDEGDNLTASLTTTNRAAMVVEDDAGDQLTDSTEVSGSAAGNAQTFFSNGIAVDVNSASTTITDDGDSGTFASTAEFAWTIKVTNIGDDAVYINKDAVDIVTSSTALDTDTLYSIDNAGTALGSVGGTIVCSGSTCLTADEITGAAGYTSTPYNSETFFRIPANEFRTYTITINGTNSTDAKQVRAHLTGIEWTVDEVDNGSATGTAVINTYASNLSIDSATPYKLIN